jgi:hypothetical protein
MKAFEFFIVGLFFIWLVTSGKARAIRDAVQ